jgi:L-ribulokinase
MNNTDYVIGIDYGTDSVRALIVDAANGKEISSAVVYYPRYRDGMYCDPASNRFRQHPLDYVEGLEQSVKQALAACPAGTAEHVRGISVDTTGSTPVAVDKAGVPLSMHTEFVEDPDAMFVLWKDHTAVKEADDINTCARGWGGIDYTKFVGSVYSSEWFWAKILHILRTNIKVRSAAFSWVEHCDWIPAILTGNTNPLSMKRSRCAAGHKAMWHASFNGLPSENFLIRLDPILAALRGRLYTETFTCDVAAGTLCAEWAKRLGLQRYVVVGVGAFDAHLGAVGGEIEPYVLSKVMGTSTCDMLIAPTAEIGDKLVRGICGQVDGSIVPGMLGMEAGQSAFGDVYAWFRSVLLWPVARILGGMDAVPAAEKEAMTRAVSENVLIELSKAAIALRPDESDVLAIDWLNGRRTPFANQMLKGAVTGLSLGSDAPRIYRALVEATAFGAKKIVDRFVEEGITIKGVIGLGGVAKKAPFVMQTVSDVLGMPIRIARSEQACALGSAMAAAVVAGLHPSIPAAQKKMGNGFENEYTPIPENTKIYVQKYKTYSKTSEFIENELTTVKEA